MSSSKTVKVGLTQMACADDPQQNLANQLALVEQAPRRARKIICTQELFRSQYFCQVEDHRFFKLAETIPGPSTDAFAKLAKKHKVVIIASLFEKRAAGLYHNTAASSTPTGRSWASTARCTSPTTRSTTRSSTSRPATPGSALEDEVREDRRADLLGPVVPRRRAPHRAAGRRDPLLPHRHRLAPRARSSTARPSTRGGKLIQRSHAVANGCYVCAPNRIGLEHILDANGKPVSEDGIQFWGQSFVAAPDGQVVKRASVDKEEVMVVRATWRRSSSAARTGRSCATGGSTRTGNLTKRFQRLSA